MSQRDEAAYEALGMLSVLYREGDIPKSVAEVARDILVKAGEIEPEPAKAAADYDRAVGIAARSGADAATVAAWRADRAAARVASGESAAAIDDLRSVAGTRGAPDDHRNLAAALASSGDWHGAREAYDRAIAASPQPQWLGERALVLVELGDDAAAGADLDRCVQADPSCARDAGALAARRAGELGRPAPGGIR